MLGEWTQYLLHLLCPLCWASAATTWGLGIRPAVPNQVVDLWFWIAFLDPPPGWPFSSNFSLCLGVWNDLFLRGALHLLWSFMLGLRCDHMKFEDEDCLPSGYSKQSCWYIIFKSFLRPSSRMTILKQSLSVVGDWTEYFLEVSCIAFDPACWASAVTVWKRQSWRRAQAKISK